jgi:hypothetical protein
MLVAPVVRCQPIAVLRRAAMTAGPLYGVAAGVGTSILLTADAAEASTWIYLCSGEDGTSITS